MQNSVHHMLENEIKDKGYHHSKLADVGVTDTYIMKEHFSGVKYLSTRIRKLREDEPQGLQQCLALHSLSCHSCTSSINIKLHFGKHLEALSI